MIIITGVACSGKTTLATKLVEKYNYFYLCKDDIIETKDLNNKFVLYKTLQNIINTNYKQKIILEATFNSFNLNSFIEGINNKFRLKLIRCVASEEIIIQRMINRNFPRDLNKWNRDEDYLSYRQREPIYVDSFNGLVIDTTDKDYLERVIKYLDCREI